MIEKNIGDSLEVKNILRKGYYTEELHIKYVYLKELENIARNDIKNDKEVGGVEKMVFSGKKNKERIISFPYRLPIATDVGLLNAYNYAIRKGKGTAFGSVLDAFENKGIITLEKKRGISR